MIILIIKLRVLAKFTFLTIVSYCALRIGLYLFYRNKVIAQLKNREKMIGHYTGLRENNDLPLWRAPAIKKKPPSMPALLALITREIMRTKGAQCNTKE